jgi:hypothetical protein
MRTAIGMHALALALASVLALALVSTPGRADEGAGEIAPARSQVDASVAQMRATSLRVREQLRTTRKRGTRLQITCVDEALSRADVALRRAREVGEEALAAYARNDVDAAHASLRRLAELTESQRLAAATATACAPAPPTAVSSGTTVKLEISRTIAPTP